MMPTVLLDANDPHNSLGLAQEKSKERWRDEYLPHARGLLEVAGRIEAMIGNVLRYDADPKRIEQLVEEAGKHLDKLEFAKDGPDRAYLED